MRMSARYVFNPSISHLVEQPELIDLHTFSSRTTSHPHRARNPERQRTSPRPRSTTTNSPPSRRDFSVPRATAARARIRTPPPLHRLRSLKQRRSPLRKLRLGTRMRRVRGRNGGRSRLCCFRSLNTRFPLVLASFFSLAFSFYMCIFRVIPFFYPYPSSLCVTSPHSIPHIISNHPPLEPKHRRYKGSNTRDTRVVRLPTEYTGIP